jgi:Cu2+-exporting ATPase
MAPPCFHCGQPVTAKHPPKLNLFDELQFFCCPGCQTVCLAIVKAGHKDYYRYRESPARQASDGLIPAFVHQLDYYDHPEIQQEFVTSGSTWREVALILEEIRCAACLWLNERHLRTLNGILDVDMDYTSQRARIRWDPARVRLSDILKAITEIGYTAYPYNPVHREALASDQKRRSLERILFAAIIGMVVMNFSIASYLVGEPDTTGQYPLWIILGRWTALIASTAILAYPGQEFFHGAWRDLKNGQLGMDVPIVIGLAIAWGGSLRATVTQNGEVYYDSIAMFVLLLLVARFVELRGRLIAARSLDFMARAVPATARRLRDNGEEEVPVVELIPGDMISVAPGKSVPIDGIIVKGGSNFDESLLTGEVFPVKKHVADEVVGGSVNGDHSIVMRVTRRSRESILSDINRLVERSTQARPNYAKLAEQAALWFVAIVLLIAGVTATVWTWLDPSRVIPNLVAVLIVTCPCALALATPVAIALSAARFTEKGILPLRMNALEALAVSKLVVFDKTGTLTEDCPRVEIVKSLGSLSEDRIRQLAASLDVNSTHPFAKALRTSFRGSLEPCQNLRTFPAEGVEGRVGGDRWRLGKPEFALRDRVPEHGLCNKLQTLRGQGYSVVMLANDEGPQALIALTDGLRGGLQAMLIRLRREGVKRMVVLSGDHPDNVARVAGELEIDEFYGGLSPADKLNWIKRAQADGYRVIMVGDGINDTPTLAAADTSLSFAQAARLARSSSDFVIMGSTLTPLAEARHLARRTRRILVQNLVWAAMYNFSAVPLAALGYIPPWGAAIGMSLSSLLVVGNSLRLKHDAGRVSTKPSRSFKAWRLKADRS